MSSRLLQELNPKLGINLKSIYVRKKILFHLSLVTHFIFLVFFPWNINLRSVHQSGFPVQCFLHNPPTNIHFTPQRGLWPAALLGTCLHFLHFNFLTHFFKKCTVVLDTQSSTLGSLKSGLNTDLWSHISKVDRIKRRRVLKVA